MTRPTDTADAFLAELAQQGRSPVLKKVSGTLRFDLVVDDRVEPRLVTIDGGVVAVGDEDAPADTVVRLAVDQFDAMARGEVNATAAMLRGELVAHGDLGLALLFQRVFPGPPRDVRDG